MHAIGKSLSWAYSSWKAGSFGLWLGMTEFIYVSDIFCPWCFGFAPVLRKLESRFQLHVRVYCGNLVDEATQTSSMGTPRVRAFFRRLSDTTGRELGSDFFHLLEEKSSIVMDSHRSCLLLTALKTLAQGRELEQMEAFQEAFYLHGEDVLSPEVQANIVRRWAVRPEDLLRAQDDDAVKCSAREELAAAEDLLGDFVVYPTLFVHSDDGMHAVARGYAPFEKVEAAVLSVLSGDSAADSVASTGHACSLDGTCA